MKKYIINSLFALTIAGFIASCNSKVESVEIQGEHEENESRVELSQAQYEVTGIELGKLEFKEIGSELMVNGVIDVPPQNNISITMPYGGFVKNTTLLPGDAVKKGQLLVSIENPEFIQFQQDYLESLANSSYLKSEYERQEKLYGEQVASGKTFEESRSNFLANEARIKTSRAKLKMIGFDPEKVETGEIKSVVNIYSPVSGSVLDVFTNIGKYVSPQDVIMDLTNSDDLHVELSVYENDIPKIKKDQRIKFNIANTDEEWREAHVFLVGKGVRKDRSVTVHGHFDSKNTDLLPGMYVTAKIEIATEKALVAPDDAVVRFGEKHFIFSYLGERDENGQPAYDYEMIEVMMGNKEDGFTQVTLLDSARNYEDIKLVTEGAFTLLSKAKNSEEEGGHH
ncbi:membrane fusion protein, cobalt-zinc-cadmium efflux system [Algoriphagus locisalis]|jgi:membrane fusion protein, heavy metal efflux system|uniref:Membrane fusion protein, cobalt-zinc-cadmium efflux system n=1 Tax=Algoriphagus locisalis TaxID=305507 RepID=A0A1I7A7L8_9BACT|nr:efflux RND transporter periplasmic adaptor subunit [Algoriphagus locisalis]SFT70914.1 membrane fusion protein, cobalt-zinc-cadmium efflux system [Algoriphagus locisalis]